MTTGGLAQRIFGASPLRAAVLLAPAIVVVALDRLVRGRLLTTGTGTQLSVYLLGATIGGLVWVLWIWLLALLLGHERRRAAFALVGAVLVPMALLSFPCQLAYFRYASTYSSANTVPIAWQLRSTVWSGVVGSWSTALPGTLFAALFVAGIVWSARFLSASVRSAALHVPLLAGTLLLVLVFGDRTWTNGVSALPPDASFVASMVGAVLETRTPRGLTVRTPAVVPALTATGKRSVVLIVSESVRADVMPSERDPARPSPLDESAADRLPLLGMTSQASSTIISCFSTWSGLPPDVNVVTAHRAPLLFELAKAAGYRTAYVGAQRGDYQRLGVFLHVAGLDVRVFGEDLDPNAHEEAGAPDDRATARALAELSADDRPTFLVLHLSSTHYPYRTDPRYVPHQPMTTAMSEADKPALWNRYRNAILLQEHILAAFFAKLRALPGRADLVSVLVSDHGEQFYEHGAFSHIRSLHDEELRVPAFVVAGPDGLSEKERAGLAAYRTRRVYNQDIHATIVDLLGLAAEAKRAPYANARTGRSLLVAPQGDAEPVVTLANANGIWGIDRPMFGAMQGPRKAMARENAPYVCFDTAADPGERRPLPPEACGAAFEATKHLFPPDALLAR